MVLALVMLTLSITLSLNTNYKILGSTSLDIFFVRYRQILLNSLSEASARCYSKYQLL